MTEMRRQEAERVWQEAKRAWNETPPGIWKGDMRRGEATIEVIATALAKARNDALEKGWHAGWDAAFDNWEYRESRDNVFYEWFRTLKEE